MSRGKRPALTKLREKTWKASMPRKMVKRERFGYPLLWGTKDEKKFVGGCLRDTHPPVFRPKRSIDSLNFTVKFSISSRGRKNRIGSGFVSPSSFFCLCSISISERSRYERSRASGELIRPLFRGKERVGGSIESRYRAIAVSFPRMRTRRERETCHERGSCSHVKYLFRRFKDPANYALE